jgi:hypothetical protein
MVSLGCESPADRAREAVPERFSCPPTHPALTYKARVQMARPGFRWPGRG